VTGPESVETPDTAELVTMVTMSGLVTFSTSSTEDTPSVAEKFGRSLGVDASGVRAGLVTNIVLDPSLTEVAEANGPDVKSSSGLNVEAIKVDTRTVLMVFRFSIGLTTLKSELLMSSSPVPGEFAVEVSMNILVVIVESNSIELVRIKTGVDSSTSKSDVMLELWSRSTDVVLVVSSCAKL